MTFDASGIYYTNYSEILWQDHRTKFMFILSLFVFCPQDRCIYTKTFAWKVASRPWYKFHALKEVAQYSISYSHHWMGCQLKVRCIGLIAWEIVNKDWSESLVLLMEWLITYDYFRVGLEYCITQTSFSSSNYTSMTLAMERELFCFRNQWIHICVLVSSKIRSLKLSLIELE